MEKRFITSALQKSGGEEEGFRVYTDEINSLRIPWAPDPIGAGSCAHGERDEDEQR
jgi:hypothetical protein